MPPTRSHVRRHPFGNRLPGLAACPDHGAGWPAAPHSSLRSLLMCGAPCSDSPRSCCGPKGRLRRQHETRGGGTAPTSCQCLSALGDALQGCSGGGGALQLPGVSTGAVSLNSGSHRGHRPTVPAREVAPPHPQTPVPLPPTVSSHPLNDLGSWAMSDLIPGTARRARLP